MYHTPFLIGCQGAAAKFFIPASAPGSVRFREFFVFPRPAGGGTQIIISVVWTIPQRRRPLSSFRISAMI